MSDDNQDDKRPSEELREGLRHLFTAARKVIKSAEPHVTRSLDDAERVIDKLGKGGEAVAAEVGKEVATLANKLADKLRQVANRENEAGTEARSDGTTPPEGEGSEKP